MSEDKCEGWKMARKGKATGSRAACALGLLTFVLFFLITFKNRKDET